MKSLSKILAKDWKQLRHGKPGSRFIDFYRARADRRAEGWPLERVLILAAGIGMVVGGLAIGWVVQVLVLATGFVLPAMVLLGVVFAALYGWFVVLGGRIDRERAEHQEPGRTSPVS